MTGEFVRFSHHSPNASVTVRATLSGSEVEMTHSIPLTLTLPNGQFMDRRKIEVAFQCAAARAVRSLQDLM